MNAELKNIFENSGDCAAKWGISSFYDEDGNLLEETIKTGKPFMAEWGSKKEPVFARIVSDGKSISVKVSSGLDMFEDLLDSAIWEAEDKKDYCGASALSRLFGVKSRYYFRQLRGVCNCLYQESFTAAGSCKNDFESLTEALDMLETEANNEAGRCYQSVAESVKAYLETVKADNLSE